MGKAPERCLYCQDGTGRWERQPEPSECGFCDGGVPLDTQEDWDNSWGRIEELLQATVETIVETAESDDH